MATENQLGRKLEKEKPQPPLFEGAAAENEEARSSRGLCRPLEMGWWSIRSELHICLWRLYPVAEKEYSRPRRFQADSHENNHTVKQIPLWTSPV